MSDMPAPQSMAELEYDAALERRENAKLALGKLFAAIRAYLNRGGVFEEEQHPQLGPVLVTPHRNGLVATPRQMELFHEAKAKLPKKPRGWLPKDKR